MLNLALISAIAAIVFTIWSHYLVIVVIALVYSFFVDSLLISHLIIWLILLLILGWLSLFQSWPGYNLIWLQLKLVNFHNLVILITVTIILPFCAPILLINIPFLTGIFGYIFLILTKKALVLFVVT